ncbi:MAG TPA: phosphatidylcholine/phosphatidylserine synthase [Hyphomicrobiales bacterium]|nr:phosphatidylcholine/phosphatidylserine synthase [Hyphomicrobiales bacterium]
MAGTGIFQPFDPDAREPRRRRFRPISVRVLLPNLVTLLALSAGLTAIRMALEARMDIAVYAIVAAAVLDGIDGRLARLLKGTSRFGAELDSLADFVDFGVAPAIVLYVWTLSDLGSLGWIGALVFAIAAALRLARFNIGLDAPKPPAFALDYFVGVPAPAGAIVGLLPVYCGELASLGFPVVSATAALVYVVVIAALMVSRFPSWSFKRTTARIDRDWVVPLMLLAVLIIGLLVSYPWQVLLIGSLAYLAALPPAWVQWRRQAEADQRARAAAATGPAGLGPPALPLPPTEGDGPREEGQSLH